jgi:hypothetical protein
VEATRPGRPESYRRPDSTTGVDVDEVSTTGGCRVTGSPTVPSNIRIGIDGRRASGAWTERPVVREVDADCLSAGDRSSSGDRVRRRELRLIPEAGRDDCRPDDLYALLGEL